MGQKVILIVFLTLSIAFASRNNAYLSREAIDTTVQNAFNAFVMASRDGGGLTQERAIRSARETAANLRKMAETDPNRRYILWRLSELESQISLEEEEVRYRQRYAQVQIINELVVLFNNELLVPRPNFANLQQLYNRMTAIDAGTTNQFADRINQKMRSVSHNLTQDITEAFNRNNYAQAEKEFLYAVENRRFLRVSDADLERWRRRIQIRKDADYLQANIGNRINTVNGIVRDNRLLEARRHVEVLGIDLNGASALLPRNFVASTRMQLNGISANIERTEDSLVQHGQALINARRFEEASVFLRTVLMPAGVNRDRIAGIDRAIIAATGATMRSAEYQTGIQSFSTADEGVGAALNQRMMQRTDSIRAAARAEEERARSHFERRNKSAIKRHNSNLQKQATARQKSDEFLVSVQKLFDSGKSDAAVRRFRGKQAQAFANGTPMLFHDVKVRVNSHLGASNHDDPQIIDAMRRHNAARAAAREAQAGQIMGEILDLLERRRTAEAFTMYYFNMPLLTEFAYPQALISMRRTLVQAYTRDMM